MKRMKRKKRLHKAIENWQKHKERRERKAKQLRDVSIGIATTVDIDIRPLQVNSVIPFLQPHDFIISLLVATRPS